VALTIIAVAILMFTQTTRVGNTRKQISKDHAVIMCLLGQPDASRTGTLAATALVTCQQTVK
jgi:hypothetical protein